MITDSVRHMAMPDNGKRTAGIVVGSMVAITFGTIFVLVNSAGLPDSWPLVIRAVGLLVAALLIVGLVLVVRKAPRTTQEPASGFVDRRYWTIVAVKAAALFGGLFVINGVLHRTAVSIAWVALVVGMHFFGLARIWRAPSYHCLGAAMTVLGLAGFLIYALGGTASIVGLVAGVGSGAALYAAVGVALRDAMRDRTSAA
jgi:MFS family permease